MTTFPQSRPPRILSRLLPSLLWPLLLMAGCATQGVAPTALTATPSTTVAVIAPPEVAASGAAVPSTAAASDPQVAMAPVPVDPLRPDLPLDLDDRSARVDLWQRVRRGFAIPDLDGDLVRSSEQWYATRPDYVQRMTERGGRYLFYIVEELDRRGMPTELALLPFIESAFNPRAMSSAKASGMWQFMPATGKDFDLTQNVFRDDRRDVLASTRAALDYLQKLYGMFGDWHLALAAYNWGEGNVQRAIARNQKLGLPTDYASLKMPDETRQYVPKLQAVKNIVARPQDFGLTLPALSNHPYFLSVPIERDMDVAVAMRLASISPEEFKSLNPQMNKPVILAAGTTRVLLPYDNANLFVRRLPQHHGPLASWTAWVAPRTLRPAEVAKQVGMNEEELREVNHIPPRMLVKAGSTLLVARGERATADVSNDIADNAMMTLAPDVPPQRRLALKAGKHDSVASIAKRYRVSTAQVAHWNGVAPGARFKRGQIVTLFVPAKEARAATTHRAKATTVRPTRTAAVKHKTTAQSTRTAAAKTKTTTTSTRSAAARSTARTQHARATTSKSRVQVAEN
ncbi:MAG: transglycosylase SLT domain-containing protein [Burkholderiaceae bacterium]